MVELGAVMWLCDFSSLTLAKRFAKFQTFWYITVRYPSLKKVAKGTETSGILQHIWSLLTISSYTHTYPLKTVQMLLYKKFLLRLRAYVSGFANIEPDQVTIFNTWS